MSLPSLPLPGQEIGPSSKFTPGSGTHIQESQLCASIIGHLDQSRSKPPMLSISRPSNKPSKYTFAGNSILPEVDSIVLSRITRLTPRQAVVEILVVDNIVCREGFQGIIRMQDVRATEKDRVKIGESFRVGDIVRGVVISLGDQTSYYLSTASNELGVIMAKSEEGNLMVPISWQEYRDETTGKTERRKVAKPL